MKKNLAFILIVIAAGYVNAQQTARPLFRDFMNKKNEFAPDADKSIVPTPKSNVQSQKSLLKPEISKGQSRPGHDLLNFKRNFSLSGTNDAMAKLSHVLPNGNMVYILPQDNMPCVVPDTRAYNMPTGSGDMNIDEGIYATPPQRIIPLPGNNLMPQQQTTGKK